MANQGIIHIAFERGGVPLCRNRRAHMSTTPDRLVEWDRVCVKCQANHNRAKERAAKKAAKAQRTECTA